MKDGTSNNRKGDREIISVSLPVAVYDVLQEVCENFNINRSAFITSAIADYLQKLGKRIGER